jgi:uncharacterized tellurite resistance protein B-like protein
MEQLKEQISSSQDRSIALKALDDMILADGVVNDAEREIARQIMAAVENVDLGIIGRIRRLIRPYLIGRSHYVATGSNREEHFDDFIKNRVYYYVQHHVALGESRLAIPEIELRKLCLAGGLMARIAHVDKAVTESEVSEIVRALQASWGSSKEVATFVAEVAVSEIGANLDYYRLTREFFDSTNESERLHFLDVLFAVACSDGRVSYDEIEEIRAVSHTLKLEHKQFIAAKVRIPRKLRDG